MLEREKYRELILRNIEYKVLAESDRVDCQRLDELLELILDTVCSRRESIRIAGDDYPAEVVRSRFLKLNSAHIEYILERMQENTTHIRNIKKYLLAALYNAPTTMDSYYASTMKPMDGTSLWRKAESLPILDMCGTPATVSISIMTVSVAASRTSAGS